MFLWFQSCEWIQASLEQHICLSSHRHSEWKNHLSWCEVWLSGQAFSLLAPSSSCPSFLFTTAHVNLILLLSCILGWFSLKQQKTHKCIQTIILFEWHTRNTFTQVAYEWGNEALLETSVTLLTHSLNPFRITILLTCDVMDSICLTLTLLHMESYRIYLLCLNWVVHNEADAIRSCCCSQSLFLHMSSVLFYEYALLCVSLMDMRITLNLWLRGK